jgi:hypothetical protein
MAQQYKKGNKLPELYLQKTVITDFKTAIIYFLNLANEI